MEIGNAFGRKLPAVRRLEIGEHRMTQTRREARDFALHVFPWCGETARAPLLGGQFS